MEEKRKKHPSYGMLEISKVSCSPSAALVGSSIKHQHFYSLTVSEAHQYEMMSGMEHKFAADKKIVEIHLSANQLVDMISHMNTSGIPCTLSWTREDGSIEQPPEEHVRAKMHNDIKADIKKQGDRITALVDEVDAILAEKKPMNKKTKEHLSFLTLKIKQYYEGNAAWLHKVQEEHLEKVITQVGCEVESTVSELIRATGVKGLEELIGKPEVPLIDL